MKRERKRRSILKPITWRILAPLEERIRRDVKGMYAKAIRGEIKEFTGIGAPFEEPKNPDLIVYTDKERLEEGVGKILEKFYWVEDLLNS